MFDIEEHKLNIFASLFKARNDIYAVRWEKNGQSGYMPAYEVDWSDYKQHKARGGTFKDYPKKEKLPFDQQAIKSHLTGKKAVGVYPLLEDNTSYFIAVDFDKKNWKQSILNLYHRCSEYGIPSYIERSRSGDGGHLWIFFENPVPADQSRKLMFEMLRISKIISHFEKEPSFEHLKERKVEPEIHIKETNLYAPFDYRIDNYETISRILIHDTQRNNLILSDIQDNIDRFNTILVLTERKAHVDILNLYLKNHFETIPIHGEDSEKSRKNKIEQIKQGHFRIVISTGQYFGEGMDIEQLECLFIVYPFAFEGKLVQYIGRIQRSKNPPVIFDYRDKQIDHFEKMFKKRNRYYKKLKRS